VYYKEFWRTCCEGVNRLEQLKIYIYISLLENVNECPAV